MSTLYSPFRRLRRWWTPVVALVNVAFSLLTLVVSLPGVPYAHAQETAATTCNYRVEGKYADSLCWINFAFLDRINLRSQAFSSQGLPVTMDVDGGNRVQFNLKIVSPGTVDDMLPKTDAEGYSRAAFGNRVYKNTQGTPKNLIGRRVRGNYSYDIEIRDIQAVDHTGAPTGFGMAFFDGESSNVGETTTVTSNVNLRDLGLETPPNFIPACGGRPTLNGNRYQCVGTNGRTGTWGVAADNPTEFNVNFRTGSVQNGVFAFYMLNVSGRVTVDRSGLNGLRDNTQFSLEAKRRNAVVGSAQGENLTGLTLIDVVGDEIEFNSVGRGSASPNVRYQPNWTCTMTDPQGESSVINVTPREEGWNRSSVVVPISSYGRVHCAVNWVARRELAATLKLTKRIEGTAANNALLAGKRFLIDYQCSLPGFAEAFPHFQDMTGSVDLSNGQSQTVSSIPVGSHCTFTERGAFTDRTLGLQKQWTTADGVTNGDTTEIDVVAGENPVTVLNRYDNTFGKVSITKQIEGDARDQFKSTPITFKYQCSGDTDATTLTVPAVGDAYQGSVDSELTVPLNRDCQVWEDIELSDTQREEVRLSTHYAVGDAKDLTPLAGGRINFRLPADQSPESSMPIRVVNTYERTKAPLTAQKTLRGVAAPKVAASGARFSIRWECIWDGGARRADGIAELVPNVPTKLADVHIGASCRVYEEKPIGGDAALRQVELVSTTVRSDSGDKTNEEAKAAAPYIVIGANFVGDGNKVTIDNEYADKLGTLQLQKILNTAVDDAHNINYNVSFACGDRIVSTPGGGTQEVSLKGRIALSPGGAAVSVAADAAIANDQPGGAMGVPYGNECVITEDLSNLPEDATGTNTISVVSGSPMTGTNALTIVDPTSIVRITNDVQLIPGGLFIEARATSPVGIVPDNTAVRVVCRSEMQGENDNHVDQDLTLANNGGDTTAHEFRRSEVPEGSICKVTLKEEPDRLPNPLTGGTYPIKKTVRLLIDGKEIAGTTSFTATEFPEFTVGDQSRIVFNSDYDYDYGTIVVNKHVEFDQETADLISDKEGKRDRNYEFSFICTSPRNAQSTHRITATGASAGTVGDIPVGSVCTSAETVTYPDADGEGLSITTSAARGVGAAEAKAPGGHAMTGQASLTFEVTTNSNNVIDFTNTFGRQLADVNVVVSVSYPGDDAKNALKSPNNLATYEVVLTCTDPSNPNAAPLERRVPIDRDALTDNKTLSTTVQRMPVGVKCEMSTSIQDVTFDYTAELPSGAQQASIALRAKETVWAANTDPNSVLSPGVSDPAQNKSLAIHVRAQSPARNVNTIEALHVYDYVYEPVSLEKRVKVPASEVQTLRDARPVYRFANVCKGPDLNTLADGRVGTVFDNVSFGDPVFDFVELSDEGDNKVFSYTSSDPNKASSLPVGSFCEIQELAPTNTPRSLRVTAEPGGAAVYEVKTSATNMWRVTNTYTHADTKIAAYHYKQGSAAEMGFGDTASFNYECTLDGRPTTSGTYVFNNAEIGRSVHILPDGSIQPRSRAGDPIAQRREFRAPAGSICTVVLDYSTIPARAELAATGRGTVDRRPLTTFVGRSSADNTLGLYVDSGNESSAPEEGTSPTNTTMVSTPGGMLNTNVDTSGPDYQNVYKDLPRRFSFKVPEISDAEFGYELITSNIYVRDTKDVQLTKEAIGVPAGFEDREFVFDYECQVENSASDDNTFTGEGRIRSGETLTLPQVPVDSWCGISEHAASYALDGLYPAIRWTLDDANASRLRWFSYSDANHPDDPALPPGVADFENSRVVFKVEPVADAADVTPDERNWAFKVTNHYPRIKVKKTIAGALVSENGTAPFDTAVLETGTNTMTINYRVTNPSNNRLSDLVLKDPSLVGGNFTLATPGRRPMTIDPDGTLRGLECATFMEPGQEFDCAVVVTINSDIDAPFAYRGEVTVTAASGAGTVRDSDSFGALRLPRVAFLLPNTGTKAMVWVLGIGLLVLLAALWNYLRRRGEDDDNS